MIATPLKRPGELRSVAARSVDRSTVPPLEHFAAHGGTAIAYWHYPARGVSVGRIAIVVHGSSGSNATVHGLAGRGAESYAPDMRGYGGSGARDEIGYLGELEDDLEDLVVPGPRVLALRALGGLGITCCEGLATPAFAVPPSSEHILVPSYSYRLMRNVATRGYEADFAAATIPVTLFSGAGDELMVSDKYADAVDAVAPEVDVKLIDGVDHMGIVGWPKAVAVVAENVAKPGAGS